MPKKKGSSNPATMGEFYRQTTEHYQQTSRGRWINHPRVVDVYGGGLAPEQYWGTLDDGREFYFRMRSATAALRLAPAGTDHGELPLVNPEFSWEEFEKDPENYPHRFFLGPEASVVVYPEDPLVGFFIEPEDRERAFAQCLDLIDQATPETGERS